jgi:hypothetical protein
MLTLLALLLTAEPEPEAEQPFFEAGGVHLLLVQGIHGLILGPAIYLAGTNNTQEDTGGLIAPAVMVPVGFAVFGVVAGHGLRPSVVTAYESATLGWAGLLAGFSVADAWVSAHRPAFNLNWLWPTRFIAGAVGHLIGSFVALVPRQTDPPGWRTWVTLGGTVAGAGLLIALQATRPSAPIDPEMAWGYALPFALGCMLSVMLRVVGPEEAPQIAPTPLDHGAGVAVGGRW